MKKIFYLILLFIFSTKSLYANEKLGVWHFYKVSKNSALSEENTSERKYLIDRYKKDKIILINYELVVDRICTITHETMVDTTTFSQYLKSTELVDRYKKIFSEEAIPLDDKIEVTYRYNDKDSPCFQGDFNGLIKTGDYYVVMTKSGYLMAFKKDSKPKSYRGLNYKTLYQEFALLGHPMLSDKNIVNKMNGECNFPDYGIYYNSHYYETCSLNELGAYFTEINDISFNDKKEIYQQDGYKYFLTKKQIAESNFKIYLNIEKNNKIIDKISIYKEKILEPTAFMQYYYIDQDLKNIWLLNYVGNDKTHDIKKWRHYTVDDTKHFKLLESISCKHRDENGRVKCQNN